MGAQDFTARAAGATPKAAFATATDEARAHYGNRGYTGSIAEKHSFIVLTPPAGEDPAAFASRLLEEDDPRIDDKSGPAGCVDLGGGEFLFFGWARC